MDQARPRARGSTRCNTELLSKHDRTSALFDVNLADAFLLPNIFDAIPDFIGKIDIVPHGLDDHQRRRCVGSIEQNVFDAAESIKKRLLFLNVLHPVKLESVGHLAENSVRCFQAFRCYFVDRAFRLEIDRKAHV